jgi:hypothetical protein
MSAFTTNTIYIGFTNTTKCKPQKGFLPNIDPVIFGLSDYDSSANIYHPIFIAGENFFPNGATAVNFGSYTNLAVTYYSSFNISFIIPIEAVPGNYIVQVISLYSGSTSQNILYSNTENYTLN